MAAAEVVKCSGTAGERPGGDMPAPPSGRNYGIDALRLLSMLHVVILHILGEGGILAHTDGAAFAAVCLLEVCAYCAVNCYALTTGYVFYSETEKPFRPVKYAHLYLSVFTWSLGISLGLRLLMGPESVPVGLLLKCAHPITAKLYWYATAYTALFFFIPYLNRLLRGLTEREATGLIALLFVFFSLLESCFAPFKMAGGYSVYWLAVMYLFGGWMKKCRVCERARPRRALAVLLAATGVTWLLRVFGGGHSYLLTSYVSPTVVLNALSLFVLFARLRVGAPLRRLVAFLSPAAFGVYLCHTHPLIEGRFASLFSWIPRLAAWQVAPCVLGCAAALFVLCLAAEKLRLALFRCLGIDRLVDALYARAAGRLGCPRRTPPDRPA